MIDSLDFGKYIYDTLHDLVDNRVYPLVADNNVSFPFIIYQRTGLTSEATKDGFIQDDVRMRITVVAETYSKSLSLAKQVRERMEVKDADYDGMTVEEVSLLSGSEEYINNAFIQTLEFDFILNNL